ncbi:putative short-chain dehydrogenase [Phaeomoniella chlamydospora]|uniref:Putative short-chain dehydrogenase n=1 Tax=Phaeomoniella chlamydospora TaxID=158046 RepID=A0A0G2EPP0_PHACM|nr:putative short-chain dehydrogenase [Phaeomoniella chlamydospora]
MTTVPVPQERRTVFITGCSDGGLGSGLALEFHKRGLRVLASARNLDKMSTLKEAGIETVPLDVLDPTSISDCVNTVSSLTSSKLDILINNAGGGYNMSITDISLPSAKQLFDLNVWSYISVIQAFLPLLLHSRSSHSSSRCPTTTDSNSSTPMIVNNTSISSVNLTPFNSVYHASKAALASFTSHLRLELSPFNIYVVDLKTGSVRSNFHSNRSDPTRIPSHSLYLPIRKEVEDTMNGTLYLPTAMPVEQWAADVVDDLLRKDPPPVNVWRGRQAGRTWWEWCFAPTVTWLDRRLKEGTGLARLERILKGEGK